MNLEEFFEYFELLAETPDGIKKLRELILQFAFQGKFLTQNPNDETAFALLEKIKVEKDRLIKEKKICKERNIPDFSDEAFPFEIPKHWNWCRLIDICSYVTDIEHTMPKSVEKGVKFISAKDLQDDGSINFRDVKFISEDDYEKLSKRIKPCKGDIIFSRIGTIGKSRIVNTNEKFLVSYSCCVIRPLSIDLKYLNYYLDSGLVLNQAVKDTRGIGVPDLGIKVIKGFFVPLPPLEEQHRIVAKVDLLMALCDQLEASQQQKHEQRISLNIAALDKLLTAPTPGEFAQHWQRICDNFDLLYDAPETVGQLRQAILQLAVQGKLVAQDSNNKLASQLINEIIEERKKWYENECEMAINIGSKKPKKPKMTPIEFPDELDLPRIPESWQFCLFDDIAASKENAIKAGPFGSALTKNCYVPSGYKIYGQEQVIKGDASYGNYYIDDTKFAELNSCEVAPGDILISLVGTIGKVLILPNDCESGIINPRLVKLSLNPKINQRFIEIYLNAPLTKDILSNIAHGGTMNILNLKILKNLPIPIPPTEEQAQIVAKVDQLMALCDQLEAGLVQAQTEGGKLMEAVVQHVLAD